MIENYIISDDGRRVWSKFTDRFVGYVNKETGYCRCGIGGKNYLVHRLVWMKFRGEIPEHLEIDHINDIRSDNRLENLQLLTHQANTAKRLKFLSNSSGYTGVSLKKSTGKYGASFQSKEYNNGKLKHLGYFKTTEEAARFRDAFIIKNGFKHHRLNFPGCVLDPEILKRLEKFQTATNSSGYTGVSFNKQTGKWRVQFQSKNFNGGKRKHLGYFKTAIEAARFRDNFIIKNGFSHRLNFS